MASYLEELAHNLRPADVLDVLLVAAIIHVGLTWLRPRASRGATVAVLVVAALYAVATRLEMYLTLIFFRGGLVLLLVSLVIVFQADIRRAFGRLAAWPNFAAAKGAGRKRRRLMSWPRPRRCWRISGSAR